MQWVLQADEDDGEEVRPAIADDGFFAADQGSEDEPEKEE